MKEEILRRFFIDVTSELFSPSFFKVLDYYASSMVKEDLGDIMAKEPKKVYEILIDMFGTDYIQLLDLAIISYLRERYDIDMRNSIFELIKMEAISDLKRIAFEYYSRRLKNPS